ncbi:site-specific integrase [Mycobacterium sp. E3198]|uniref:tyrosine-type recombinase/integrase n=1 Tax=Mycobacterium sp. E3198 TaxID=1834143 RepID=UPI0007FFE014|nr:site-specific integrase [Mycobacterium sp. E3198]OBG38118.1 hypothetical protein A5673_15560 [Mycobacterium sp. E3198]
MASTKIRYRADGSSYTAVLYRHGGKQTSSSFGDHAEALRFQDVCNRLGPAEALRIWESKQPKEGLSVAEFIERHIDSLSGLERKTLAEYRRYLTRDIDPALGPIPLSTLGRTDVSRWVNTMRDDGASGKTIQNKVGFLSGCLNAAVQDGLLPANPAIGVRLPRTVRREMTFLTMDDYRLLKAAFTEHWHPFLDFLVASGCRISEATALTPGDVDTARETVRITKAWKRIPGGVDAKYELGAPKSRRSNRTVAVPKSILEQLDYSKEYLFTTTKGLPIRVYSWRTNVWMPSVAKAKTKDEKNPDKVLLTKPVRIHDLRHTAASWWLGKGVPLITVSAQLGHDDTSVTAKIYGHLDQAAGQAAAIAMAEMMSF